MQTSCSQTIPSVNRYRKYLGRPKVKSLIIKRYTAPRALQQLLDDIVGGSSDAELVAWGKDCLSRIARGEKCLARPPRPLDTV